MGFSAGGHLAATLSTQYSDRDTAATDAVEWFSSRPDFTILVYPVISFGAPFAHSGSRLGLLGEDPSVALIEQYSNERQVKPTTPPAILIHAADDEGVPPDHSHAYAEALQAQGIAAEVHIYLEGGHGFGLAADDPVLSEWIKVCHQWLVAQRD